MFQCVRLSRCLHEDVDLTKAEHLDLYDPFSSVSDVVFTDEGGQDSSILCDSLGVEVTNKVMATNHFTDFLNIPRVALFNPEVTEKTGISSFQLIEMVVKKLKPSMIIMVDSLATNKKEYLNNCIEVNNTGIIPGSAIKDNKKIDQNTFGIPVIAIGVPLVLEMDKDMYTTPNVGEVIHVTSDIISDALNDLFF